MKKIKFVAKFKRQSNPSEEDWRKILSLRTKGLHTINNRGQNFLTVLRKLKENNNKPILGSQLLIVGDSFVEPAQLNSRLIAACIYWRLRRIKRWEHGGELVSKWYLSPVSFERYPLSRLTDAGLVEALILSVRRLGIKNILTQRIKTKLLARIRDRNKA